MYPTRVLRKAQAAIRMNYGERFPKPLLTQIIEPIVS
jgi:hypothetical protein